MVRRVDSHWVEVSLGERRGLVPVSYLEEEEVGGSRQSSLSSSPCTPPSPNPGVMVERLTRPTDIIKSRLRGHFCRRERSMVTVERFLQVRGEPALVIPVSAGGAVWGGGGQQWHQLPHHSPGWTTLLRVRPSPPHPTVFSS